MLQGFKDFLMRGNLVELAVAVILATSFGAVVIAFTNVVLSLAAKLSGGQEPKFDDIEPGGIPVGAFLTALVAFLILAAVVYFFVVTPYNKVQERLARGEANAPPDAQILLLTEIRDLLQNQTPATHVTGAKPDDSSQA